MEHLQQGANHPPCLHISERTDQHFLRLSEPLLLHSLFVFFKKKTRKKKPRISVPFPCVLSFDWLQLACFHRDRLLSFGKNNLRTMLVKNKLKGTTKLATIWLFN